MTLLTHALIVGVADYLSVDGLPDAVRNDVGDIADVLQDPQVGGVTPDAMELLVDAQASASDIRSALRRAAEAVPADAVFLFYFSGHGDRGGLAGHERSWVLPYDADLSNLPATALSSDELIGLLRSVRARRQVIIIDACHAGGIGSFKTSATDTPAAKTPAAEPRGLGGADVMALAAGGGRVVLTSSRDDEVSLIRRGARNSVFTEALLEARRGGAIDRGDGLVGALDVFAYVARHVPERAEQHPVFHAGDVEGDFAIARRAPPKSVAQKTDAPAIVRLMAQLYPAGPIQDSLWTRAGGDLSRLELTGSGVGQWHSALRKIELGGGGLSLRQLLEAAAQDYPDNPGLMDLLRVQ